MLSALGIASYSRRPNFLTLERIARSMQWGGGATVECGVYRGSTLLGVAHILRLRGIEARMYGLDSFEGFPAASPEDFLPDGSLHERAQAGAFADTSCERLQAKIARLGYGDTITLIKGFFADTLPALSSETFSLVHLDCDLYQSYMTCLEFFYRRTLPGGYIVFDEYAFSAPVYPAHKRQSTNSWRTSRRSCRISTIRICATSSRSSSGGAEPLLWRQQGNSRRDAAAQ